MNGVILGIDHTVKHLKKWMKDDVVDTPLIIAPAKSKIMYEPLGVALIMGAWNFPYVTHMEPLTNAIAAGCSAVVKPSEVCVNTTKVMDKIIT